MGNHMLATDFLASNSRTNRFVCKIRCENFLKSLAKFVHSLYEQRHSSTSRIIVLCQSKKEMENVDVVLWTYEQLCFVPHGTEDDKYCSDHPILIVSARPASDCASFLQNLHLLEHNTACNHNCLVVLNYECREVAHLAALLEQGFAKVFYIRCVL